MRNSFGLWVILTSISLSSVAYSWGGGDVDDGPGGPSNGGSNGAEGICCISIPLELEEEFAKLETSLREAEFDGLLRQSHAGELCANHPCGDSINEDQAREFFRDLVAADQRKQDMEWTERANSIAWIAALISAAGILLAAFGLWQTHLANRIAREASDRSIRNDERLTQLKEAMKS